MTDRVVRSVLDEMARFLLGKQKQVEYALTCLLARGHLLIEDVPGVGKTTLAKSIAQAFRGEFNRVQFTSDMLPSDLIGVTVFHQSKGNFEFQPGPIFTNVLLADEINRANPKTQSALLEAMHDAQISHDGKTMRLPQPFFVVATQNSKDQHGTFPLPESQLDRFLMKIHIGYPDERFEKRVIRGDYEQDPESAFQVRIEDLAAIQARVSDVRVHDEVLNYVYHLIRASRNHPAIRVGVSPRGGQALYRAGQALAYIRGRDFVIPDDIRELAPRVCAHRVLPNQVRVAQESVDVIFEEILETIKPPV